MESETRPLPRLSGCVAGSPAAAAKSASSPHAATPHQADGEVILPLPSIQARPPVEPPPKGGFERKKVERADPDADFLVVPSSPFIRAITEPSDPGHGLTIQQMEAFAEGLRWCVLCSPEQVNQLSDSESYFASVRAIILVVSTSDSGLELAARTVEALAKSGLKLPEVVAVLQDSHIASEPAMLHAQRRLMEMGIEEIVSACRGEKEWRVNIKMALTRGRQKKTELFKLREQFEERFKREVAKLAERPAEPKTGLFWQAAHRTFEGFPSLNTSLPTKLDIGAQVGDCILEHRIGSGSYGTVYSGINDTSNRHEAVKAVDKDALVDMNHIIVLWKEICCHSKLDHPNIVKLYGVAHGPQHVFLRMEMAGSTTLFRMIRNTGNSSSLIFAVTIFSQLSSAIAYCHSKNVAHRDLKPENIVVAADKITIKVCDFGTATPANKLRSDVVGTIPFIAPEVMNPERRRGYLPSCTDIWALGVILLEMICGIGTLSGLMRWPSRITPSAERFVELSRFFREGGGSLEDALTRALGSHLPEVVEVINNTMKFSALERWQASEVEECQMFRSDFLIDQLEGEARSEPSMDSASDSDDDRVEKFQPDRPSAIMPKQIKRRYSRPPQGVDSAVQDRFFMDN